MYDALKLLLFILVLCFLALLGNKMETILDQTPSALDFEKMTYFFYEGERPSLQLKAVTANYSERSGVANLTTVEGVFFDDQQASLTTTLTSRFAESKSQQIVFREKVVVNSTHGEEQLKSEALYYFRAPFRRVFCPVEVVMTRPGVELRADTMDSMENSFMKKFNVKGHVQLEIQGERGSSTTPGKGQ